MEPVNSQERRKISYFLPNRAVLKETSSTKKTRVIFGGNAKTSHVLSLKDVVQVGQTVQQDLCSFVLR